MKFPEIICCGRNELSQAITSNTKGIISLNDPGKSYPECVSEVERYLDLYFYDTTPELEDSEHPAANIEDIESALEFGRKFQENYSPNTRLVIHCNYGQSRSTAIALGIKTQWYKGNVQLALAEIVAQRRVAYPNLWISELMDYALKLERKLDQIVEEYRATGIIVSPTGEIFHSIYADGNEVEN